MRCGSIRDLTGAQNQLLPFTKEHVLMKKKTHTNITKMMLWMLKILELYSLRYNTFRGIAQSLKVS